MSMQIFKDLAAIVQDVSAISKDGVNKAQNFRFRGIDQVYNSLHPIFAQHGVTCIPVVDSVTHTDAGKTKQGTTQTRAIVVIGYKLTASDGSFIEGKSVGEGVDSGDKATAKALSAAHKYFLIQTFLIPVEDIAEGDQDYPEAHEGPLDPASIPSNIDDLTRALNEQIVLMGESNDKREYLGVISELRCRIADLNVAPEAAASEVSAPVPGVWQDYILKSIKNESLKGRPLGAMTKEEIMVLFEKKGTEECVNHKNAAVRSDAKYIIEAGLALGYLVPAE